MKKLIAILPLLLLSCSQTTVVKEPTFPEKVAPNWTRSAVQPIDPAKFPPIIQSAGIKKAWQTEYQAADGGTAKVDAYAVLSNTQGLDLVQRWRPERDNAQFYTDHFLLNVAWQKASHDELAMLVRSLPKLIEGQP